MSSSSSALINFLYEGWRQVVFDNYCSVACSVLIFYEHFITLDREFRYIWKHRLTAATVLLLLNRQILLLYAAWAISSTVSAFTITRSLCQALPHHSALGHTHAFLYRSCLILTIGQYVVIAFLSFVFAAFCALRIYAVSGGKWHYALMGFVLGLSYPGVVLYYAVTVKDAAVTDLGNIAACTCNVAGYGDGFLMSSVVVCTCIFLTELSVLLATWVYTSQWRKHMQRYGMRSSLMTTLLIDGTIYFLAFLILAVLVTASNFAPALGAGNGGVFSTVSALFNTLPNILLSRFIFNLQHASSVQNFDVQSDEQYHGSSEDGFHTISTLQSSVKFAGGAMGNLGAPLNHGSLRHSTADDEDWENMTCNEDIGVEYAESEELGTQTILRDAYDVVNTVANVTA